MAEPTKAELAGPIRDRLDALNQEFMTFRQIAEYRLSVLEVTTADHERAGEQSALRFADVLARVAAADERLKALEKFADRSWGVGEKLLIALASAALGGVVSYYVRR